MKRSIGASLVLMTFFGCSTTPQEPVLPDGRAKVTLNNPTTIAQTMSDFFRTQSDKKSRAQAQPAALLLKLPISQIVERYLPGDFRVFAAEGVDLETVVAYNPAKPWVEALGKPLSEAGIEMTANLEQKTMMLRVGVTTIEQVLNQQVPLDYVVYADAAVKLNTPIKVDRSKPWVEGLGKALGAVGVAMTTNLDQKMIVLKQRPQSSRIIRFTGDDALADMPSAAPKKPKTN